MMLTTLNELAEILKVEPMEVETLRRRHRWPHVKVGRRNVRFTETQVAAIIAMHTVDATNAKVAAVSIDGQTERSKKRAS